jgi:hypothetical protein
MSDRDTQDSSTTSSAADDSSTIGSNGLSAGQGAERGAADTESEEEGELQTRAATSIAPDPGDPGGMGGVRVKGGNALHRPPGGVSPIAKEESSDD